MQINRRILYTPALSTGSGVFSPTSVQSSNFIARTTGLTNARKTLYDAMITGIVNDLGGNTAISAWPILDALYILAADASGNALLNLVGSSFSLTVNGSVTFTADHGYVSDGSTGFLDTGFQPDIASGNYAQNSAAFGAYILGNRTVAAGTTIMGVASNIPISTQAFLNPLNPSGNFGWEINAAFLFPTDTTTTAAGLTSIVRSSSTAIASYKNNSSSAIGSYSETSAAAPSRPIYILAYNNVGTAAGFSSTDQVSAAYISGALTGAQHLALSTRVNTYMTALGINVY